LSSEYYSIPSGTVKAIPACLSTTLVPDIIVVGIKVEIGATVGIDVGNRVGVGAKMTFGIAIATVGCIVGICADVEHPVTVIQNRVRSSSAFIDI
jgi:hypothetical protein